MASVTAFWELYIFYYPFWCLPFLIYSLFVWNFGMNRNIRGIEKIGWTGLTIFMMGWVSTVFIISYVPWYLRNYCMYAIWILQIAYFIASLIIMAYKWGDEPLWGKKE
jgi:hypothetical protein